MNYRKLIHILIIAFLVFALAAIYGCKNEPEKARLNGEKVTPGALFPPDVPIYTYNRELKIQAVGKNARAEFVTSSETEAVFNFYKASLVKNGWEATGSADQEDKTARIYKKGERILTIMVQTDSEGAYNKVVLIIDG